VATVQKECCASLNLGFAGITDQAMLAEWMGSKLANLRVPKCLKALSLQ
jgi:hypothetical protein